MDLQTVLTEEEVTGLFSPLSSARGLPARVYTEQRYWDLERERMFRAGWFGVGFATDVPKPGDVYPVTIAGWELLLVHGEDGIVRCFHNVCRHRGTKLVRQAGNMRVIACGWHCWTYSLAGALVHTPILNGPRTKGHEEFDKSQLGLTEIRTETWCDIVFVNLDGKASSFTEFSASFREIVAPYELDGYDLDNPKAQDEVILNFNWKVYHEGSLEGYHIPFVHKALELPEKYRMDFDPASFTSMTGTLAQYKRIGSLVGMAEETFDPNPAAREAIQTGERIPYSVCSFTPTIFLGAWPEAIVLTLVRPISPTQTAVRRRLYFAGSSAHSTEASVARQKYHEIWSGITEEDADYWEGVQTVAGQREELGLRNRFSPYWEMGVQRFQQRVAAGAYGASVN